MKITAGNLIDQLSIINIKIYMLENVKRDKNATDKEIAAATRKTNVLNEQRNAIIDAIDVCANEVADGKKQRLFGSNKMYGIKK